MQIGLQLALLVAALSGTIIAEANGINTGALAALADQIEQIQVNDVSDDERRRLRVVRRGAWVPEDGVAEPQPLLLPRKGGGGGGARGGGGSSSGGRSGGGSSSGRTGGGSSSSSGRTGTGSSSSRTGSSGSSSGSSGSRTGGGSTGASNARPNSNAGGQTTTGSGAARGFGGGNFYGGGARVPYRGGSRSPLGITPFLFLGAATLAFWPGLWLYGAYHYNYPHHYEFRNETSQADESLPVICGCDPYSVCGCDENNDTLKELIGNGDYNKLDKSVVTVTDVNGTKTILINGTLPNGTTAPGGTEDPNGSDDSAGGEANAAVRHIVEALGFWPMVAISIAAVYLG